MIAPLLLLACSSGPPPQTQGLLLHLGAETAVVQHDDLVGRLAPGVERYRIGVGALPNRNVKPGDRVDLWLEDEQLRALEVVGQAPLPDGFQVGGLPLKGTVVNVDGIRVTVDHEAVDGVMGAMVMGFGLAPWEADRLATGDRIEGRLLASAYGWQLVDPVKTGTADASVRSDIQPLSIGEVLPRALMVAEDGSELVVGQGQGVSTALTFIYTRCPDPSFCPAIAARMASLQGKLKGSRIVTVSLDPDNDSPEVLAAWGAGMGADTEVWRLARAEPVVLQALALQGGQHVMVRGGRISHLHRLLILDADGVLVERYDDNAWAMRRVVSQLESGLPRPSPGAAGTKTPTRPSPAPTPAQGPRPR